MSFDTRTLTLDTGPSATHWLRRLRLDPPLLAGLIALAALGLVVLYSASGQSTEMMGRQLLRLAAGFGAVVLLAQVSPDRLRLWAPVLYAAGLVLLLAVEVIGDIGKGAQRWLDLGFMRFQPSELMKIAVPMMLAWYLRDRPLPPRPREVALLLAMIGVPAALVLKQPDLGTALLIGAAGLFVVFLSGLRWKVIAWAGALALAAAPVAWYFLRGYQRKRILTFLNPESDPLGSGYHIIQSKIALGSGGLFGKGWLHGSQGKLEFLPERTTDFIFAVYGEEFGLMGIVVLLALYAFIFVRGMMIASQAPDTFTRLLAGSLVMSFGLYMAVNMGMVCGLLPVVGVPLPLVSFGGTSLVTILAGFGILMSIQGHRRLLQKN